MFSRELLTYLLTSKAEMDQINVSFVCLVYTGCKQKLPDRYVVWATNSLTYGHPSVDLLVMNNSYRRLLVIKFKVTLLTPLQLLVGGMQVNCSIALSSALTASTASARHFGVSLDFMVLYKCCCCCYYY